MPRRTSVLFISGRSAADVLGGLGRAFRTTFEHFGHTLIEANFATDEGAKSLDKALSETDVQFVFSFVGGGADFKGTTNEGQQVNLWQGLRIPFITIFGDSPAYFFDRHVMPGNGFAALYGFPEHLHLRKRLPNIKGLVGSLPHVVLDPVPKNTLDFGRKQRGPILFLKNGNNPEQLLESWRHSLPESVFLAVTDLASSLVAGMETNLANDIDQLVLQYFRDRLLDANALVNLRLYFTAQLDDYMRRVKSTMIVESLLDFPIEVHGVKWEHVDFHGKRAKLVPGGSYEESKGLIKGALALLDVSPNTGLAPHDRPLRAMGAYTLCLTNEQQWFAERFEHSADFMFRFNPEAIQQKVANVLANPRRYVEIGADVAEKFMKSQPTDAFGRHLLDVASYLRLESSPRFPSLQDYFAWPPEKLA